MFCVYYDGKEYKLRADSQPCDKVTLATFKIFDMAYEYVMHHNSNYKSQAYSRWTVQGKA